MSDATATLAAWALATVAVAAAALALHVGLFRLIGRFTRRSATTQDLIARGKRPARTTLVIAVVLFALPKAPIEIASRGILRHLTALALIAAVAWLLVVVTFVFLDAALRRYSFESPDNRRARKIHTQVMVLRRMTVVTAVVVTAGIMLMTFPRVRALGASILASAGVIGLVAGIAARNTLGNLIAGIQVAFSEPIKLDDVVVVEGEWGRVEEITLTYVVVRIWDQRRLILPVSYFIEQPFENWTRRTSELLGPVELEVDYTVEVDDVRAELERVVRGTALWDGRLALLQVIGSGARTMTLRALVSATDATSTWDLRCLVRERLIAYLKRTSPGALPRVRADLTGATVEGPALSQVD